MMRVCKRITVTIMKRNLSKVVVRVFPLMFNQVNLIRICKLLEKSIMTKTIKVRVNGLINPIRWNSIQVQKVRWMLIKIPIKMLAAVTRDSIHHQMNS